MRFLAKKMREYREIAPETDPCLMANSADPDQLASEEANWSGSTQFAKAGCIRVQQDKG